MFSAVTSLKTYLGFSSQTRPRKRARVSEDERPVTAVSLVKLTQDREFWLDDGNIVLIARDVGFRIYRGLLAAQSTVFADMFGSSNSTADEYYEDCPVVRLSDSPEDLRYLLRVLVPRSYRMFYRDNDKQPLSFDEISAVIRLSHKYHVADAQRQALSALKLYFSDDFSDLRGFEGHGLFLIKRSDAIAAVNIARLTETTSILPIAFYRCCELGTAVMDGCLRADGYIEHLSVEDHKICMIGRLALLREARALVFRIFQETSTPRCLSRRICRSALHTMLVRAAVEEAPLEPAVFRDWTPFTDKQADRLGLCRRCRRMLLGRELAVRREIWGRLPEIFGLYIFGWGVDDSGSTSEPSSNW
ncbi:hypothetical protein GSI_12203 [Ganoderma sinense ZZ0214-1]|uniref:BTB domain-containing protein n=1 Tax=Ganoderma sinense ZZ0214-1 TaxID=1077348 RepID=A0A2G8RY57_9APHY|nr:hypothetical protein GSI_12203 [Ganoderma sinense ZZ0214-1]